MSANPTPKSRPSRGATAATLWNWNYREADHEQDGKDIPAIAQTGTPHEIAANLRRRDAPVNRGAISISQSERWHRSRLHIGLLRPRNCNQ
jgi:hypothetical protein